MNSHGHVIISLCKSAQLIILNGRSRNDKTGKVTISNSRGTSLQDYVLTEDALLRTKTCNFSVVDFNLDFDYAPNYPTVKTKENSNKQHNIL